MCQINQMTGQKLIGEETTIHQSRDVGQRISTGKVQHLLLHLFQTPMTKGFGKEECQQRDPLEEGFRSMVEKGWRCQTQSVFDSCKQDGTQPCLHRLGP